MVNFVASTTLLAGAAAAAQLARRVPQPLGERDVLVAGGWGLSTTTCPPSTSACGSSWCCPNSLTCNRIGGANIANLCCKAGSTCLIPLQQTPFCADNSWSLWQSTTTTYSFGWFCCLPGQVGLQSGDCVASETVVQESLKAKLISAVSATGSAAASSTGSASVAIVSTTRGSGTTNGAATGAAGSSVATDSSSSGGSISSSTSSKSGLGLGAIIGIAVGVVAIGLVICAIIGCLCIKNRRMKKRLAHQPYNDQRVLPPTVAQTPMQTPYVYKYPEAAVSPQPTPSPLPTPVSPPHAGFAQLPADNKHAAQLDTGHPPNLGDSRMPAQLE